MPLRVGILGSGFGGAVHAPAFAMHPAFDVVAIASPNNAATVAQGRNIPHAYRSLEEMLANCDLDVVSIASPPFDHHASVMKSLGAGKHVLCEKPFALTLAQAQEMVAAANEAGSATAIAHEFRYCSAPTALKELIDNGHMNALREIEITRFGTELRADSLRPRSDWWFSKSKGGGMANAMMPHIVDLANWYAGRPPIAVHGFLRTANTERIDADGPFTSEVADGCFALLDYGRGLVARLSVDATLSMQQTTVALHGEQRTAVATGDWLTDMRLFSVEPDEQSELELKTSPYAKYVSLAPNVPSFIALLDDFARDIETGSATAPSFQAALETQRVLAAIGYGE